MGKALTEEEKAKRAAEKTAKSVAPSGGVVPGEKMISISEAMKLVDKATTQAYEDAKKIFSSGETMKSAPVVEDTVNLMYQAEVSPQNHIKWGPNGKFGNTDGNYAILAIPKRDFGEFRDSTVQKLLAKRELIVLSGLTDSEREMYDVQYSDGEFLAADVYKKITIDPKILEIFPQLCVKYREMIAVKFATEYFEKGKHFKRDLIMSLNDISRRDYSDLPAGDARTRGAFISIIEDMNDKDVK